MMTSFRAALPEIAERETRCLLVQPKPGAPRDAGLPPGTYAFTEFYCGDLNCDCRRVFIQVIARDNPNKVLASINYGWENESFYRRRMPYDPEAPRQVVEGSLDPINAQSTHSAELLNLFQKFVADEPYRQRLRRHNELFQAEVRRRQGAPASRAPGPGRRLP